MYIFFCLADNIFNRIQNILILYRRSIFGMIHVYNRLNQEIVVCPSIKAFQRALTSIARSRCQDGDSWWPETFHMHRVAFLST